ncbi:hypothetical protein AMECASPLE_017130 [Ameca splendens]|uniref:Uncharacterized protein n=1 Tax=Ameca splendens TaxID=208324 RepID=A0ABV0YDG4_9TELE
MAATGSTHSSPVPPALPPQINRSTSEIPSLQPIKPPRKNMTKPSVSISDESDENIYEDPDALLNLIPDVSQSEAKPKPIPRPRTKAKLNPKLYETNNTIEANYVSMTSSGHTNSATSATYNRNTTNTTDNAITTQTTNTANTTNTSSTTYSTNATYKPSTSCKTAMTTTANANTVTTSCNIRTRSSTNASTVNSTYNANRTCKTNKANFPNRTGNTKNGTIYQSRKNSIEHMTLRPARQPLLPPMPAETKGVNSTAAGGTQNSNTSVKKPSPLPPSCLGTTSTHYCDKENPTSHTRDITSRPRAPPLPPPRIYQSRSMLDQPSSESRETSPEFNSEEEHYHSNNVNRRYLEIVPDNDFYQDIPELLQWLKRVSKQSDILSLYGLSMEDEIRCFNQQAMHVRKARRLYHILMMKRKETMQNNLKEFQAICDKLDKVQKTNKAMGIAGGTTGAVGGVTAVVGIALAPMTMGASLIATAVGAGLAASAGGFGAHAVKANKKIVNRETVEKLVNDYKSDVVDLERCLHYILCVMKELRRHDIGRLQQYK